MAKNFPREMKNFPREKKFIPREKFLATAVPGKSIAARQKTAFFGSKRLSGHGTAICEEQKTTGEEKKPWNTQAVTEARQSGLSNTDSSVSRPAPFWRSRKSKSRPTADSRPDGNRGTSTRLLYSFSTARTR
jgi:hypothetical protein